MFNEKHQLCLTQQGLNSLKIIASDDPDNYEKLYRYLFTDLCYYPLQGRLLLNRYSKEKETETLIRQLSERFKNKEIREVCYFSWLIIYLNHKSTVYLLDFISLKKTFFDASLIWREDV